MEIWKDIKGYEGVYEISNLGKIKRLPYSVKGKNNSIVNRKEKILKVYETTNGYLSVRLSYNGKVKNKLHHRLVAEAFIPNINNHRTINHIDGNKKNNSISNLEWCSYSYNLKHAFKNNLKKPLKGEDCPLSKLTEKDVLEIRDMICKGVKHKNIAEIFNISKRTVSDINVKKSWSWL